ncbi:MULTISPECIES: putative signal transducing protein [Butyricimonas]|jgi:hypothetical protein|uniref:DUF2007 domain-containing protein n=1 Tax=Butyricimonas faecihominis TaxID=1472416 RepID=A0A7W6HZT2_9BACT|nr:MULTISPECIES: DUF2007 domain-containing protein [Butyricimonas]MBS6689057.1 DUF2007 domain-containing protein [Sanguibacteroides justesenii]KAB1502630.1 DUF2007 domain-containing protein [Butyricimonas faecihominis]MBB4028003.1 hypothetical protein [Butyricimonas faecihominis]WOF08637.1 DUF2007 domain-containing protein [Butyricimonas faecihominis]BEI55209.1 hypothetical protein Bfae18676_01840 [Butyricimonas faecihominis]
MSKWSVVHTVTFLQDAYMIKSYLESAGIETLIPDEFTAQVNNFYTTAIGGVRLMVRTEDLESGVALLKEGGYINPENSVTDEEILIVGADSSTDMTCCPFCGSANIGKRNTPGMAMVILYFLLSALFPIFRSANKCFDCGKIWKFKKIRQ